jgi:hypothetical protein
MSDRFAFQGDSGFSVWKLSTDRDNRSDRNVRDLLGSTALKEDKALNLTLIAARIANNAAASSLDRFRQRFGELRAMYKASLERKDRFRGSISRGPGSSSLAVEGLAISSNHSGRKASTVSSYCPSTPFGESRIFCEVSGSPAQLRHELSLSPTASRSSFNRFKDDYPAQAAIYHPQPQQHSGHVSPSNCHVLADTANDMANLVRQGTLRGTDHATEATTKRSQRSASISTGSSSEKTSVFADLDQRIATSMRSDPSLGSAEAASRTLHSLPGGPRALVYGFDSALGGADGENAARPFRCPFDMVHPQAQRSPDCKEPILYSAVRLWYVHASS